MKTIISSILILCSIFLCRAQNVHTDKWMYDMNKIIGNKPLNKIILPGAYKCGLDRINAGTAIPERCNTQSQDTTIYGLLCRGARYLDMSVICWRDNNWYLGSYNYSALFGMQMAIGQSLDNALDDIVKFLTEKRHTGEIIILHVSGYADSKKNGSPSTIYGELDSLKKEALMNCISDKLKACLYKEKNPMNSTVNQVLASVQKTQKEKRGAAIALFNDTRESGSKYQGILKAGDCYSKTEIKMNTCYKKTDSLTVLYKQWNLWEKTHKYDCYTVLQWVLTWRSTDNKCNQQLAQSANSGLIDLLSKNNTSLYPQVFCVYFLNRSLSTQFIRLNVPSNTTH